MKFMTITKVEYGKVLCDSHIVTCWSHTGYITRSHVTVTVTTCDEVDI